MTPEMFGAVGNGTKNDTRAFQALAAAIRSAGGGVIALRPGATYVVGRQALLNKHWWMFRGEDILCIENCSGHLALLGNGATIRLADNLKFGTFTAAGKPTSNRLPYVGPERSSPLARPAAIFFQGNSGTIHIENLDLDGNVANLEIGGPWSTDSGYQLDGDGLMLQANTGRVTVINVKAHHWPRDGAQVSASVVVEPARDAVPIRHSFQGCDFHNNARQGLSLLGGRGIYFRGCRFRGSADPSLPLYSPPAAGVDLEAEHGPIRDIVFEACTFHGCPHGAAFVAASGDTEGILCKRCTFDNSANWAAWLQRPNIVMKNCRVFGAVLAFDAANVTKALRFMNCHFSDNDADSMSGIPMSQPGVALLQGAGGGTHGVGMHVDECTFRAGNHAPAVALDGAILTDCEIDLSGSRWGFDLHNCIFRGKTNIIATAFDLPRNAPGSRIHGIVFQNGILQYGGRVRYNPSVLPANGTIVKEVSAPAARRNQYVVASFSRPLRGVSLTAWVSAPNAITVQLQNKTKRAVDLPGGTLIVNALDH